MEVTVNLNRRFVLDALVVIELILLIVYGFQLNAISKKVAGGSAGNYAAVTNPGPSPAADNLPSAPAGDVKKISDSDYVRGDNNATLAMIEYSDFECPFCKRFHPTMQRIVDEYKGKVKWVYRHYPLSFHANAQKEAEAAECAGSLGGAEKYWKYTDEIFERTTSNGSGLALDELPKIASDIGLNQKKFEDCLKTGKFEKKVKQDLEEGSVAGVSGTPATFLLNEKTGKAQIIEGAQPYELVKQAVDQALSSGS